MHIFANPVTYDPVANPFLSGLDNDISPIPKADFETCTGLSE